MSNFIRKFWLLFVIFLFALFIRTILLSTIPNGLQQDELNAGYQGYKIIKTGSDLYGNFLPLYVNRFGDYRPAGIFYLDGISALVFGLNAFAIRFPAALFGALTVFAVYFLTKILSKSNIIPILAAMLIAISPWHIVTSRATSEQVVALFFVIAGVIFLLLAMTKEKRQYYLFSGISFSISYFFYHTPRIFIPLFLFIFSSFASCYPAQLGLGKKIPLMSLLWLLTLCMCLVTLGLSLTKSGIGRLGQTAVWTDPQIKTKIKALSDSEKGNILAARIFDNKAVIYGRTILNEYLAYFSPEFLYISGGFPNRYVVPEMGLFYYVEFPLLLIGCYFVLKRKDPFFTIPFLWILIGPLAASVTTEDIPNVQRALFMLPAFQILEAYGLYYGLSIVSKKWRYLLGIIITVALLLNGIYFWHMYSIVATSHDSFARDDGNKELFSFLHTKESNYSAFYIPSYQDLPLYYYYFFGDKVHLLSYSKQDVDKGFSLGKYHFTPDECPERIIPNRLLNKQILIVDFGNCNQNSSFSPVQTIRRQDATTAYVIQMFSK